jgi:hypothetical protein
MIPSPILDYFDNMQPGQKIEVMKAKQPEVLISAAKEYIEQGGNIQIGAEYQTITKVIPWPK